MWILDTSIAVKWFFTDEPCHAEAGRVLSHVVENPDAFAVPSLFFLELAAVLIRKSKFERQFVINSLKAVHQLGIPSLEIGQELSDEAIATACRYQISYYDALFVALAKRFKWVWLTTDGKALMKLPRSLALPLSKFNPSR